MLNRRGYSLLEILIVLVIIIIGTLLTAQAVLGRINEARGSTLVAEARLVNVAVQALFVENQAIGAEIYDTDYMSGLTGTVNDASRPEQTRLSQRMNALLAPDVILSDTPGTDVAKATFTVQGGQLLSMTYEKFIGSRHFSVNIANGETTVTQIK